MPDIMVNKQYNTIQYLFMTTSDSLSNDLLDNVKEMTANCSRTFFPGCAGGKMEEEKLGLICWPPRLA